MNLDVVYTKSCQRMDEVPDGCVDLMPTDPQYGWHFMGKDWDRAVPSVDIWRECLRVLKPGAFAFIMSGPRLDCLIENGMRIREAGFWIGFTPIFWAYASGFPKAQNIGKAVDKRLGVDVKQGVGFRTAGYDGRPVMGDPTPQGKAREDKRHKIVTPQAQALDGSYGGFQPKPAVEVILVAMKPLSEKTYVDQVLKNGKGVTWLDDCKIPTIEDLAKNYKSVRKSDDEMGERVGRFGFRQGKDSICSPPRTQGRFPANLLVSDDALNDGIIRKTGSITPYQENHKNWTSYHFNRYKDIHHQGDSGSFSRYFSLDSWFEKRLKELPKSVQKTFPFLIVPKASKAEKNRGCEGMPLGEAPQSARSKPAPGRKSPLGEKRANHHPTCKPIKLMSYLITLGSREGDIILDPFIGSGTTAIAAKMLRRHYIGYETEKEYCEIAEARLSAIEPRLI